MDNSNSLKSNRKYQRQIWADKKFVEQIQKIKVIIELKQKKRINTGDITRTLANSEEFNKFVNNIINETNLGDINLRFDRR